MSDKLAPVILFAYNRPWHTEQVLDALKKNELASQSHLIVFVDGIKKNASNEDIQKNEEVKQLVQRETWCGSVEYHFAGQNQGCRWAPINGISQVLSVYPACIILEDDIVTSPFFLSYMNKALNYYAKYKSVFSVSGYNLPERVLPIPEDYDFDVYVSLRQQNWGWGTWSDRWQQVDWDKNFIPEFLRNKYQVEAFDRGGADLARMLQEEYEEKSQAWDIQFSYAQFFHHAISIIPCYSYTKNIGLDNSGTHTFNKKGPSLETDLSKGVENPKLLSVIYEDRRFINAFYSCYYPQKRPLWQKIINRLSRIFGGKNVFVIKKKVYD